MFQGKFAIITPALIAGALAERISFKAYMFFVALLDILVYNTLCHWIWASDGFLSAIAGCRMPLLKLAETSRHGSN